MAQNGEITQNGEKSLEDTFTEKLLNMPKKNITSETSTIFRAAPSVALNAKELYEPRMVSIGPYHHNSDQTRNMERHKRQFLREFLDRNPEVDIEVYLQKIKAHKERASQFYSEYVDLDHDEFVQMLLLDGCFILEFLFKLKEKKHDILFRAGWDPLTIVSDLLLLENQIPFFVLRELYALVINRNNDTNAVPSDPHKLRGLIKYYIFAKYLHDGIQKDWVSEWGETHHLLHLYHTLSKPSREANPTSNTTTSNNSTEQKKKHYNVPQVIPSASQLYEFRVKMRKNIAPLDIFHMTFKKGVLKMPQLVIDSTRRTLLMNLLAFEKCVPESERRWTGLMILMNCLIKNKKDLEILQQDGVLLNLFSSDDEAIKFAGQLSERVTIDFSDHYYTKVFIEINRKCETKLARYKQWFFHQFFNNPWAVITFTSSMVAILLSTVQAFVSVFTYRHISR